MGEENIKEDIWTSVEQETRTIRNNQELRELSKDLDIAADIKKEKTGMVRTSSKNGLWKGG
jgi:hypothetical protein